MREIMKDPRMKNLTNLVFAILTSFILIYLIFRNILLSLELIHPEDYQEEMDASYNTSLLRKMHYMEAIEELGGRLKCRLHIT
jgi:hypothetical protein